MAPPQHHARPRGRRVLLASGLSAALLSATHTHADIAEAYTFTPVGLSGPGFTDPDTGEAYSEAREVLNNAGQTVGYAWTYPDGDLGEAAWFGGTNGSQRIGFFGGIYQNPDTGYENATADDLNDVGQVIGGSTAFRDGQEADYVAWIADTRNNTTTRLGFTGPGYQTDDGFAYSFVAALNNLGQVIGTSNTYDPNGGNETGRVAWISDGSTTQRVGLTAGLHTAADGTQHSEAVDINDAGFGVGISYQYDGNSRDGQAVWLANGSTTTRIGLTGPQYQNPDGRESSRVSAINNAGYIIGETGGSPWIAHTSGTITPVGLGGRINDFNQSGQTVGSDSRTAWFADTDGTTTQLGYYSSPYIRSDGLTTSLAYDINDAGQAIGYSRQWSGPNAGTITGWFYDADAQALYDIGFDDQPSAGYSFIPQVLSEDGDVFGIYRALGSSTQSLFAWNLQDGFVDLETRILLPPDIGPFALIDFLLINDAGQFLGQAYDEDFNLTSFILSPVIPEPHSALLFLAAAAPLLRRRRRPAR